MKIISGGQTGADRAAFDFALAKGIPHGGFVPKGRRAADGPLDMRYTVVEIPSDDVADRTRLNVELADRTLIFTNGPMVGGTLLTGQHAAKMEKAVLHIEFDKHPDDNSIDEKIGDWLAAEPLWTTLNIAGPRAEQDEAIYGKTLSTLLRLSEKGHLPDVELRDATLATIDRFMNNFRHWDTIRWTVSMGLFAFVAAVLAGAVAMGNAAPYALRAWTWTMFALGLICLLWTYLLVRLWMYHASGWEHVVAMIDKSCDPRTAADLRRSLPFRLTVRDGWGTASALFIVAFAVLATMAMSVWLYLLRH